MNCSPLSDMGLEKILFHSAGCHFILLAVSFPLQKFFSFRRSHLLFVNFNICATGVRFRKYFLCHCIQVYFPLSLLSGSVHLDLYWVLWSACTWALCMGIDMELFAFCCVPLFSYANNICWRCFLFSIVYFWLLCQKLGVNRCKDLCQGLWSYSIGPLLWFMPIKNGF